MRRALSFALLAHAGCASVAVLKVKPGLAQIPRDKATRPCSSLDDQDLEGLAMAARLSPSLQTRAHGCPETSHDCDSIRLCSGPE